MIKSAPIGKVDRTKALRGVYRAPNRTTTLWIPAPFLDLQGNRSPHCFECGHKYSLQVMKGRAPRNVGAARQVDLGGGFCEEQNRNNGLEGQGR